MKKSYLAAALSLSAALCTTVNANMLKDGGFERPKAKNLTGFDWVHHSKQKFYEIDSTVKHSGKNSLKISNIIGTYLPITSNSMTLDKFTKPLKISGWAKYENIQRRSADGKLYSMPFIGLWGYTAAGRNSITIGINCFSEGTKDWFYFEQIYTPEELKRRSAHLVGDKALKGFTFRINIANQPGTIWFDDLSYSWVEPEVIKAFLPVKDVSENTIKIDITVSDAVKTGKISIAVDNKDVLADQTVKSGKNTFSVKLDGIANGKHKLTVKPVEGFDKSVKAVELDFSKQPDAFTE